MPNALFLGEDAGAIPADATFLKWVQQVSPGFKADYYTLAGWANAQLFTQALQAAGKSPTQGSVQQQLRKITSFSASGLLAPDQPGGRAAGHLLPDRQDHQWEVRPGATIRPSADRPRATGAMVGTRRQGPRDRRRRRRARLTHCRSGWPAGRPGRRGSTDAIPGHHHDWRGSGRLWKRRSHHRHRNRPGWARGP